jgi:regulator of protease activity HflC (stomatin/prohibitin superfamily)
MFRKQAMEDARLKAEREQELEAFRVQIKEEQLILQAQALEEARLSKEEAQKQAAIMKANALWDARSKVMAEVATMKAAGEQALALLSEWLRMSSVV